jgi:hypothetical protein
MFIISSCLFLGSAYFCFSKSRGTLLIYVIRISLIFNVSTHGYKLLSALAFGMSKGYGKFSFSLDSRD